MPNYSELRQEYEQLWETLQIRREHLSSIRIRGADILQAHRLRRYETVQAHTEIPWMIIACIHSLEADLSFRCHLHNGDALTSRTVRVPAGRPRTGSPPFSWEDSAIDALEMKRTSEISGWSISECLFYFERYNGWGYRNGIGRDTTPSNRSPYLWSFTTHYDKGKYIRDHVFDKNAVSLQMGAAALLKVLTEMTGQQPSDNVAIRNPTQHDRPVIRRGSRGKYVAELQMLLRDNGFSPGEVDGIFGSQTEAAARSFQQSKELTVDGIVGSQTWAALTSKTEDAGIHVQPQALSELRKSVSDFAFQEACKGRQHAPGNEIDRKVLDPLRPILKELGHLGKNDNDSFFNWCAAWVTYICRNNNAIRIPDRYGNFWASMAKADAWRDMAMDIGAWFRAGSRTPLPGDIVVYNWDDDSDTDHIGILKELDSARDMLTACEGNHNNQEAIVNRRLSDVEGFIDLEVLKSKLDR